MPKGKKPTPKMPMKGKMPLGMPPKGMVAGPSMPMMTPAQMQQMMSMKGMPPAGMPPKGMPAWAGKAMKPPMKPSKPAPKRKK